MSLLPRSAAVSVGAVVALAVVIGIAVARGGSSRPSAGTDASPTARPAGSSAPSAPVDLATLTEGISCPDAGTERVSPDELSDFDAVAVFSCGTDERTYADGEWTVETRRAATPDIAAIVRAIQAPEPAEPSEQYLCDLVAYGDPGLVLVDSAGRSVVPEFRRDFCEHPIGLAALAEIQWQDLGVRKISLQQSAEEIAAGCSHQYKNMNYYQGQYSDTRRSAGGAVFPDDGALLHACLYVAPSDEIDVGTFVRNLAFTAEQSDRLRTALSGPGATADCAPQHSFALVFDGKHQVDVELGGCHRVLRGPEVGTADAEVLADLFGQS